MVHRGPAKGCGRCKDRHVKCDLVKPQCGQCLRLGFDCPGYLHPVDVVLRDQTPSIKARFQRRQPNQALRTPGGQFRQALPPIKLMELDLEARAINFLFSRTVLAVDLDWRATHGHFEVMLPLYRAVRSDSVLACAMSWYAVLMMGTCSGGKPYPLENNLLNRVIRRVRQVIADPLKCLEDETLSAVMILQYGQYHFGRQRESQLPSTLHQDGAEALVKKRGSLNVKDDGALRLFAAVQNTAVNLALLGANRAPAWDFWDEQGGHLERTCTPVMQLDAHALTVVALRNNLDRTYPLVHGSHQVNYMREQLLAVLGQLSYWEHQLPGEWRPRRKGRFLHYYFSQDVAYLFVQYYLLQLEIVQLMQQLNASMGTSDHSGRQLDHVKKMVQYIMAAEHSLLTNGMPSLDHHLEIDKHRLLLESASSFPHVTVERCLGARRGAWLVNQVLIRLGNDISRLLETAGSPHSTVHLYHSWLDWARQEQQTIKQAMTPWEP